MTWKEGDFMGNFNSEKMTAYLDSILELGVPSVDCIVYENHKEIYRHMNGTVNEERTQKVAPDQRYLIFSMTKSLQRAGSHFQFFKGLRVLHAV